MTTVALTPAETVLPATRRAAAVPGVPTLGLFPRLGACAGSAVGLVLALSLSAPVLAQTQHVPPGASLDVPAGGRVDLGCTSLTLDGTLNLAGGALSLDADATFGATASVTGSGSVSVGGDVVVLGAFDGSGVSLGLRDGCGAGTTSRITGTLRVRDLALSSSTGRTFVLPAGTHITVDGTLTMQGTAASPVQIVSSGGTAVVTLGPSASVVSNFANVAPTVQIGTAVAPSAPAPIPTLGHGALLAISALLAMMGARRARRGR